MLRTFKTKRSDEAFRLPVKEYEGLLYFTKEYEALIQCDYEAHDDDDDHWKLQEFNVTNATEEYEALKPSIDQGLLKQSLH